MVMYSLIGVELFAYLKPQQYVNGIDIHFKDFFFSFYSLMRVVTTDGWFTIVADCSRQMEPNFTCVPVNTYDDYLKNGFYFYYKINDNKFIIFKNMNIKIYMKAKNIFYKLFLFL